MKRVLVSVLLASLLAPVGAWAHHGGVSLAFGPGSPVETNSPLTLPEGGFVLGVRAEQVAWKKFSFAEPNNKSSFTFFNLNASYGFTPAFMATVIVRHRREDPLLLPGRALLLPVVAERQSGGAGEVPGLEEPERTGYAAGSRGPRKVSRHRNALYLLLGLER